MRFLWHQLKCLLLISLKPFLLAPVIKYSPHPDLMTFNHLYRPVHEDLPFIRHCGSFSLLSCCIFCFMFLFTWLPQHWEYLLWYLYHKLWSPRCHSLLQPPSPCMTLKQANDDVHVQPSFTIFDKWLSILAAHCAHLGALKILMGGSYSQKF